jgi:iron complex transport system substrate-binding protein
MSAASNRVDRIASLLAGATEILYALGLGRQVVAVSHECDFPPEALGKPRVTRSLVDASRPSGAIDADVSLRVQQGEPLYGIDADALRRLVPQLIVTQAQCDVCAVKYDDVMALTNSVPELQDTRVVALNPQTLGDVLRDIGRVAVAAGVADGGEQLVSQLTRRVDVVRDTAARIDESRRPRVAIVEWLDPLMVAANWVPELVSWAGGHYALAEPGRHSTRSSWDAIRYYDPQVLIIAPCGFDLRRTLKECPGLQSAPGWRNLAAVQAGRVWALDGNAFLNRSGPRLVDTLEILAHLIHPGVFPAVWSSAWRRVERMADPGS